MRVTVGHLDLEVAAGTSASALVGYARARGVPLDDRPWCGQLRLDPDHEAGIPPLTHGARLGPAPAADTRSDPGRHLAIVAGPDAGHVVPLDRPVSVGRGSEATLHLEDPALSRLHVRVDDRGIADAGSTNGTRLAHRRLGTRPRPPVNGAIIELGSSVGVVRDATAAPRTDPHEARSPRRASGRLAGALGGSVMALGLAAATGRWELAALALVAPAAAWRPPARAPASAPILDPTGLTPGTLSEAAPALPAGLIAFTGTREAMRAAAIAACPPARGAHGWEEWMEWIPRRDDRELVWVTEVPSTAVAVIEHDGATMVVRAAGAATRGPAALMSAATAEAAARRMSARAAGAGVPHHVSWADLPEPDSRGHLTARVGWGADGPVYVDLDADGPHLLVAGTTGSGKSLALETIVSSLAWSHSPHELAIALIDFKGGAGLAALAGLPHVCATLSDLEPHLARRALLGLAAELNQRKRAVAAAGVSSIRQLDHPPPRLLVVVDEFQEIAARAEDFLPELTRLAAQGRSLGMHLILATQRPAGAVSADVRANVSAILALRTATEADSRDLLGVPDAATVSPRNAGRGFLKTGVHTIEVQVALPRSAPTPAIRIVGEDAPAGPSVAESAAARHAEPRQATPQLWLPELSDSLSPQAPDGSVVVGMVDHPQTRSQEVWTWNPADGVAVIAGAPGSGRSTALAGLMAGARAAGSTPVVLPRDARLAWRTLDRAAQRGPGTVVIVEDAERELTAMSMLDPDASAALLALGGAGVGLAMVVPPAWANHRLVAAATAVIVMTGVGAEADAAWSVPRDLRDLEPRPGRARLRTRHGWAQMQVACHDWAEAVRHRTILAQPLPASAVQERHATIGVGGDSAVPIEIGHDWVVAVVGPAGPDRDHALARVREACSAAAAAEPLAATSALTLPSTVTTVLIVNPDSRTVRDCYRGTTRGLIDAHPVPGRAVLVHAGAAIALQLAG